jgi:hypothetical protein
MGTEVVGMGLVGIIKMGDFEGWGRWGPKLPSWDEDDIGGSLRRGMIGFRSRCYFTYFVHA